MRLIDADALKYELFADNYSAKMTIQEVAKCIDNSPTIDAVPVVRGEWNPIFKGADTCECSVCKSKGFSDSDFGFIATPYCPYCGAEMEQ